MVSAGYSGLKVSPGSGFFVGCMELKTHEYSRSLGRLLGRAASVSAISERIERICSSTKEARIFHKLTAKSRPSKKYRSLAEPSEALLKLIARTMSGQCAGISSI
jgi:hypothetical protein